MQTENRPEANLKDPRSRLPAVSVLLEHPTVVEKITAHTRPLVLEAVNIALAEYRRTLRPGDEAPSLDEIVERSVAFLTEIELDRLRPVVNATGIILHTGLGRAVLPQNAVDALAGLNRCCNLQIDLQTGRRGKRNHTTEELICRITGAEAAILVNNNAAATLLILAALCAPREVVISRGQLIEIGGSYRLPDCIRQSGAVMIEVGTTNKTHLRDYEQAMNENTAALLHVNPSNYRVVGFSQSVSIADLVGLKKRQPVLVIDDLGCGALVNLDAIGLPHEPTVQDSLSAGADVVCFSGDKLIGGPQAGIIVGRKKLIQQIRKHPLSRMLRVGKLTDLALEHTFRLFLEPDRLLDEHPTLRMIATPAETLKRRARSMKRKLEKSAPDLAVRLVETTSETGGGSLPAYPIPTWALAVSAPDLSAERLNGRLRRNEPPIIARIKDDEVIVDMRTLMEGEGDLIVAALQRRFPGTGT